MKNTSKRLSLVDIKAKGKGMRIESLDKIKGGKLGNCHKGKKSY